VDELERTARDFPGEGLVLRFGRLWGPATAYATPAEPEHVPVREGVYGDRVAAVEPGGIELIHWITPFLAVVPLDYWLRRGDYAEREFFDRRRQRWRAPLAMAAGIAASVPFWDQGHPIPVGWFPVTAVIYMALNARAVRRRLVSP